MSSLLIDSWMLSQLKDSSTVKELKVTQWEQERKVLWDACWFYTDSWLSTAAAIALLQRVGNWDY